MVFNGTAAALFGGAAGLLLTNPLSSVFGLSWEWDGKHWTARQDMGPGPRVFQAMAFDTTRSRAVLFGGLTAPLVAGGRVLGDTWEQTQS
jgi:hypothetical protein